MLCESLREKILRGLAAQEGKVGFYYRDLVSGETLGWHADEPFLAASVIKLPIFMYLAKLDAEGALSLSERVKVREADKVPICGALPLFTDEPECDLRTLCNLMISLSDNTATNVLIERLGIEAYNRGFREMGLKKTVLQRKLFDAAASATGKENRVVPEEMGMLLEQVYRREFVNPQVSEMILDTLLLQQINHKLGGVIGYRYEIAHKTGEDDGISNDVGIVFSEEPFIACFLGNETDVFKWENFIRVTAGELAGIAID